MESEGQQASKSSRLNRMPKSDSGPSMVIFHHSAQILLNPWGPQHSASCGNSRDPEAP